MVFFQGAGKGMWKTGRDCLILKLKKFTFLTPSRLFNGNSQSLSWGGIGRVTQGSLTGKQNKGEVYLRVSLWHNTGWGLCCLLQDHPLYLLSVMPFLNGTIRSSRSLSPSVHSLPSWEQRQHCYGDQRPILSLLFKRVENKSEDS